MRSKLSIVVVFLLFSFITLSLMAQPRPTRDRKQPAAELAPQAPALQIGKVNFNAVVLLHPKMMAYDPYKKAFKVDTGKLTEAQVESRSKTHSDRLEHLEKEVERLKKALSTEHSTYNRQTDRLSQDYIKGLVDLATGPAGLKRQEYLIETSRLQTSHNSKLQAIAAEMLIAQEEIDSLSMISYHAGYTSYDETQKHFDAIFNEVKQVVQHVANLKNISIVLNSHDPHRAVKPDFSLIMPLELDYGALFDMEFPQDIANDPPAVEGFYDLLRSKALNWLIHGDRVLEAFYDRMRGQEIIAGGVDLTADVLTLLFDAYKIKMDYAKEVIKAAAEF